MLARKIQDKTVSVAVLGLGHVGYPLASLFAKNGFKTLGFDIDYSRVKEIERGEAISEIAFLLPTNAKNKKNAISKISNHLKVSNNEELLKNADVFIVDVPTPLKENEIPNLVFLENTCKTISKYLRHATLVVIESTIYPGATEEIVKPILEKSGLQAGDDFYLAFSPERIDPGNKKWSLTNTPKIVGGLNQESSDLACLLYSKIVEKVVKVSSLKVAEATKMLENVFRSVNIALINDLSKFFEKLEIDIWETIDAAASKPFAFMPHYPGPGVGGHCIPKDPFYLLYKARTMGANIEFIDAAARINKDMPLYVIYLAEETLKLRNKSIQDSNFGILGVTYKKDVKDLRRAPTKRVVTELSKTCKDVITFDPLTTENYGTKTGSLEETIKDKDCIILMVDHSYFKENNIEEKINVLSPNCCLIDTKNCINPKKLRKSILYKCLGKPLNYLRK